MATRKQYSKEFKLDAISLVQEQGYSKTEAARSLGINPNVLGRWIKEHETADGQAFRGNGNLCDGHHLLIGYMRVSKADGFQATQLQRDALIKAGIDPPHIYEDQAAGKRENLDIKATMKKKLDKEIPAYLTLGACNSSMAWEANGVEPQIGAMLPEVINAI